MLNPNLFHNIDLPYEPLPSAAYEAARISILKRNFSQDAILEEYSFSSRNKTRTIKMNALVFAHPTHRNPAEYAGLTLYNAVNGQRDDEIVKILAESSAPFHLIHRDDRFSFWASGLNKNNEANPVRVQTDVSYDQLDSVLSNYGVDVKPQRIIDVKQGRDTFTLPIFRDNVPALQLSLWAANVTRKLLVDHFALAVDILRNYARSRHDIRAYDFPVTRLAVQLLGAIILADTGVLGDDLRLYHASLDHLITSTQAKFDRYFQKNLVVQYKEAAEEAYALLRQIRYSGFVPDMLSEIYTKAFSKEQRKKLGRYDTPLYLTRRILENIPVEYLPPDQRVITDMTCGWGSFLIASHERLSSLRDTKQSSMREQLRGNDIDTFTSQLAGLGLLLSTSEDSWSIDHEDALEWNWLNTHQPNIIVGNPPFETTQSLSSAGERAWHEKANKFLEHAIKRLAPNGYLAMIMPSSFTSSLASPKFRQQLLKACDVYELWELPIEVFKEATAQTVVVFAQKKAKKQTFQYMRIRTVQPKTIDSFKSSAIFTASDIVDEELRWKESIDDSKSAKSRIDYKIVLSELSWQAIKLHCKELHEYTEIIKGASVGKAENRRWTDYPFPKQVPWLTGVKRVMPRPFFIDYKQATLIEYPNGLEEPRKDKKYPEKDKEYLLAGTKVLLPYDPHPSWGKRNKVAIERESHYVSDSFWVITPNSAAELKHITHEVIAAILSWDVSNAWIIEHLKSPAVPKRALEAIPFPTNLSEVDCQDLTDAIKELENSAFADKALSLEVTQKIDIILKKAYHLDDATFERLRKVTEWDTNAEITLDRQSNSEKANWFLSGIVKSINRKQGTVTIWLEGFDELQTVQIVPSMPGWLLRPNAAFRTKISDEYVEEGNIDQAIIDWSTFSPQPHTYLSEEELFAKFTTILQ
jgi:type I restriction-modification system DNA methylase subunit